MHNCADDCWVSIFGKVFMLTDFLAENKGPLAEPIIQFAGQVSVISSRSLRTACK